MNYLDNPLILNIHIQPSEICYSDDYSFMMSPSGVSVLHFLR